MILRLNFEEIRALRSGGRSLVEGVVEPLSSVIAPPESRTRVEALLPRLDGDLSVSTLAEMQAVAGAVDAIVEYLLVEMETTVLASHAADEGAVAAYFDFAHALTVSHRLTEMAQEMVALIELVTGQPVTEVSRRSFHFPD
ncbi:MAG: hypothetical protein P8170_01355 [Gemmatimonadota bacterium]